MLLCRVVPCAVLFAVTACPTPPEASVKEPENVVDAFHAALAGADPAAPLLLLEPDAVVFEGGHAELSRAQYEKDHLPADMEFAAATKREVDDRSVEALGDVAWVITRSRTTGTFRGEAVNSALTETMVLRRAGGAWRIAHIHWSSHAL